MMTTLASHFVRLVIGRPTGRAGSFAVLAMALLIMNLSGCQTGGPEIAPDVSLVDLRPGDIKLLESSLVVVVRVTNENPDPFTLTGGVYKLMLNGSYIGKGISDAKTEIPRLSSATQEITIRMDNIALATRIRPLIEAKRFDYRLDSRVYLEGLFGSTSATIVKEGTLDLTGLGGAKKHGSLDAPITP